MKKLKKYFETVPNKNFILRNFKNHYLKKEVFIFSFEKKKHNL